MITLTVQTQVALVQTHSYYICWCSFIGKDQKYHCNLTRQPQIARQRLASLYTVAEIGCGARWSFESALTAFRAMAAAKARIKISNFHGQKSKQGFSAVGALAHNSKHHSVTISDAHFSRRWLRIQGVLSTIENKTTDRTEAEQTSYEFCVLRFPLEAKC